MTRLCLMGSFLLVSSAGFGQSLDEQMDIAFANHKKEALRSFQEVEKDLVLTLVGGLFGWGMLVKFIQPKLASLALGL